MKKKLGCFFLSCLVFCYVVPVKAVVLDSFSSQLVANYCGDADRRAVLYIHICVDKDEDWLRFVPESENWSNDPVLDTLYTDMEFDCVIPGLKGGTHNGRGNGKVERGKQFLVQGSYDENGEIDAAQAIIVTIINDIPCSESEHDGKE